MIKISKTSNPLIKKRRRKKLIKRLILILFLSVGIGAAACLKLNIFKIVKINVMNNKLVKSDEIIALSGIKTGENIFRINTRECEKNISKDSYVASTNVQRKLPNIINIYVSERSAMYYVSNNGEYDIISENGIILNSEKDIKNLKLICLNGFDLKNVKKGSAIGNEDSTQMISLCNVSKYIKLMPSSYTVTALDLGDPYNINLHFGDIYVKLGDDSSLKKKLNKAINILNLDTMKKAKGYIDVSYNGNPVIMVNN